MSAPPRIVVAPTRSSTPLSKRGTCTSVPVAKKPLERLSGEADGVSAGRAPSRQQRMHVRRKPLPFGTGQVEVVDAKHLQAQPKQPPRRHKKPPKRGLASALPAPKPHPRHAPPPPIVHQQHRRLHIVLRPGLCESVMAGKRCLAWPNARQFGQAHGLRHLPPDFRGCNSQRRPYDTGDAAYAKRASPLPRRSARGATHEHNTR